MPVTLIGSKWSSGSLIFFTKSTGAAVITIAPALVTITPATTVTGILTSNGGITMGDAKNIITNATTAKKIGTSTSQKIGFWNVTPVIQPTAYTQTYATANKTLIADGTTDVATAD